MRSQCQVPASLKYQLRHVVCSKVRLRTVRQLPGSPEVSAFRYLDRPLMPAVHATHSLYYSCELPAMTGRLRLASDADVRSNVD